MKICQVLLLVLFSSLLLSAEPRADDTFEFVDKPVEEIVRTLVQAMGKELGRYAGPEKKASFSMAGSSPERALTVFLKEHDMKWRESDQGVLVQHIPPLPSKFREALTESEDMTLTSLDPDSRKVLGKVKLSPKECREASTALQKSLDDGFFVARCFIPRHRLDVRHKDQDLSFIICFQCGLMGITPQSHLGQRRLRIGMVDYGLTEILKRHKIPVILDSP